jgi:hypothetical protein
MVGISRTCEVVLEVYDFESIGRTNQKVIRRQKRSFNKVRNKTPMFFSVAFAKNRSH